MYGSKRNGARTDYCGTPQTQCPPPDIMTPKKF